MREPGVLEMIVQPGIAGRVSGIAETMSTPGANRSRHGPKFEKLGRWSVVGSVAPTVIAAGTRAGEKPQASALLLPADTT